jgi:hypothetical protein
MHSAAGVVVSNRGGFQSFPDVFRNDRDCNARDRRALRALHVVVSSAMDVLRANGCATIPEHGSPSAFDDDAEADDWRAGGLYQLDGWVNVNRATDRNVLHQHHPERWSGVYFVSAGDAPTCARSDEPRCGHLIFRGGPVKHRPGGEHEHANWSTHSFWSAPPVPGTLWIFAGTIPHGVMSSATGDALSRDAAEHAVHAAGARVSIAWNYSTARPVPCNG